MKLLAACVILAALAGGQRADPIRVYLFATPSEFVDQPYKDRMDSLKDVRGKLKDKSLVLVDREEDAEVVIELLGRELKATGNYAALFGAVVAMKKRTLYLRLSTGDYELGIVGVDKYGNAWTMAAREAANEIKRWVKDNREKLRAQR